MQGLDWLARVIKMQRTASYHQPALAGLAHPIILISTFAEDIITESKMEESHEEGKKSCKAQESNNVDDIEATEPAETIRTHHDDEGMKVIAAYAGDTEWAEEEEKKLVRKIDFRLLTILTVSYGLQFYDKTMLGQAVRLEHRRPHPLSLLLIQVRPFLGLEQTLT